jgi:hypothetical protein
MRFTIELFTTYGVYLFGTSLLIWRYGSKDRGPAIIVAAVVPFLFVATFLKLTVLAMLRRSPAMGPCPEGLSDAEIVVERNRQRMFGGEPLKPTFASDWARLYEKTVEAEAERVQAFARRVLSLA